jgi:hypothetical protein
VWRSPRRNCTCITLGPVDSVCTLQPVDGLA